MAIKTEELEVGGGTTKLQDWATVQFRGSEDPHTAVYGKCFERKSKEIERMRKYRQPDFPPLLKKVYCTPFKARTQGAFLFIPQIFFHPSTAELLLMVTHQKSQVRFSVLSRVCYLIHSFVSPDMCDCFPQGYHFCRGIISQRFFFLFFLVIA